MSYDTSRGEPSEEFKALVTTLVYSTNSGGEQGKGRGETCDFACTVPRPGRAQQITGAIPLRPCCDPTLWPTFRVGYCVYFCTTIAATIVEVKSCYPSWQQLHLGSTTIV